jgi:hypothetical protein
LGIFEQDRSAIAPTNITQEEERIPRVIVTRCVPGVIAISSSPQAQKVKEQRGSSLELVQQEEIASTSITQEKSVPRVIVTAYAQGAIATRSVPQQPVSERQAAKEISSPVPSPVKPQPVVSKKLSEEEIQKLENELKSLSINPESCMSIIQKYWNNVGGAIARVKEALQQGWCNNTTGLFIASCKKGAKPQKTQVSNTVNEWFTWARAKRIVIAMTSGFVYTPEGESMRVEEMMQRYPLQD